MPRRFVDPRHPENEWEPRSPQGNLDFNFCGRFLGTSQLLQKSRLATDEFWCPRRSYTRGLPRHQEDKMLSTLPLTRKAMVVIGGSRGVGRRIVEAGIRNGA